ncbi:riboflavin synthase [Croceicoccus sp. F390]|uniref:Riboflavin synthase n=1 Tax=Croceicoccus esteveae TaxID=3075597 RepID=A0ABU2ZHS4_9SPHN|nr:riboflavin synthase [Croceicoccus sp. F390]MDT0575144.1 riboflavin synthase [Croceicoccus sp. F390]
MFTGITTAIGTVSKVSRNAGDTRLVITQSASARDLQIGASIACSGVCLTVVDLADTADDSWFAVDVSDETLSRTAEGQWQAGAMLNLERALKLGDELGGHIVTGHVDAVGNVTRKELRAGSIHLEIDVPAAISPFVAAKGSVTVDGVSLTVNEVADNADGSARFSLNIIPHTAAVTTLGDKEVGDQLNIEIDVLARYLQRMQMLRAG